ncbi:acyltransferase [Nonlabens sp. SCSIO 43208]|uniref:acyltransferase n=1 Tax=Nonlabens sp. SCSIO 43208 TaxID=2793009 RepID=UPI003D6A7196
MKLLMFLYNLLFFRFSTLISRRFLGLTLEKGVKFKKIPYVFKHPTAIIKIGSNTLINSDNFGYHINMFSKCKLYADRKKSEIIIGQNCRIHGTCIHSFKKIQIGNNCLIAANSQIIDGNGHKLCMQNPKERLIKSDEGKEIIIQDNVWIASSCTILGGSFISEGSIITAGSVVKGYVPPNSIFGGNPAKLIKQY